MKFFDQHFDGPRPSGRDGTCGCEGGLWGFKGLRCVVNELGLELWNLLAYKWGRACCKLVEAEVEIFKQLTRLF